MSRLTRILLGLVALALLVAGAGYAWFRTSGGDEVAARVADKLETALDASCRVRGAQVLSTSHVLLNELACTFDEGDLVGFAATELDVRLDGPAFGSLPPLQGITVGGLHVRLRSLPGDGDDDSGDDDDSADLSLSGVAASLAGRFVRLHERLHERPGGELVQRVLPRLADGGWIRVERGTVEMESPPEDLPLPEELSAALDRKGDVLEATLVSRLSTGGTVTASVVADPEGLSTATLGLDAVDLLPLLSRTRVADVRAGTLTGTVSFAAGEDDWPMELALGGVTVSHPFLGEQPAVLPTSGAAGSVALSDDGLVLRDGTWTVEGVTGDLDLRLGPLDGDPAVALRASGDRLALGRLLAALPDSLIPGGWAEEIQGTIDAHLAVGGPLHDRSDWSLDWDADFSRTVLADGELAAQVKALHGPFPHRIPGADGAPTRVRHIGPGDPSFVPLSGISRWLRAAVISTEDAGFFSHSGFEVNELKEAVLENLREGDGRGGSTITQQLAKNLFLSGDRTLSRKLKEALIAWRLEEELPKERILEIYLNIAEWGPGLYGIQDAADHYFARTPAVLKPEEAAFLASLLPSPRRYHGYYHGRGRGLTRNRQERVQQILATMARLGSLDPREYHLARDVDVELAPCGL